MRTGSAVGALAVVVAMAGCGSAKSTPSGSPSHTGAPSAGTIDDQAALLAMYGPPPYFTVAFGEDASGHPTRQETWIYTADHVSFTFQNGAYRFSHDLASDVAAAPSLGARALVPSDIHEGMSPSDVARVLRISGGTPATLTFTFAPGLTVEDLGGGVEVMTSGAKVVEVDVLPPAAQP